MRRKQSFLRGNVAVILISVSFLFSSCGLINRHAVANYKQGMARAPYDVIIVPGIPFDSANINILLKSRVLWAKALFEKRMTRNIIFSGSAVHSPYIEGMVMKIYADSLGIPASNTFIESRALHSNENVDYGISLARELGFSKIAVATDPFQSFFLSRYSREKNMDIAMLPFSVDSMPVYNKSNLPRINASAAFIKNFVPLSEREN